MKKELIVIALIGVLFVLVMASIISSFSFYKEYKDKVGYLEQQSVSGKSKLEGLEAKLDNFKSTVDDINSQIKGYSDNIKSIQNTVSLSEEERKALMLKLEDMKKDLLGLQKDYSTAVIDIRQSMMVLKDNLDMMESKSKDIELGKIMVKQSQVKEDKTAVPADAAKKPATNGLNIKSGSVRKAGTY